MPENELKPQHEALIADWFNDGYARLVRFLSRRLGANAEVEDLAQEVYLRLMRVERADLVRSPRAYLNQVAAHILLEWRLRARQQRPHSSEALDDLIAEDSPEHVVGEQLTARQLNAALRELPPMCQAVLLLRSREDLTNEEIAARLGITRRMVKRHLESGYAWLRARLSRVSIGKEVLS